MILSIRSALRGLKGAVILLKSLKSLSPGVGVMSPGVGVMLTWETLSGRCLIYILGLAGWPRHELELRVSFSIECVNKRSTQRKRV